MPTLSLYPFGLVLILGLGASASYPDWWLTTIHLRPFLNCYWLLRLNHKLLQLTRRIYCIGLKISCSLLWPHAHELTVYSALWGREVLNPVTIEEFLA